MTRPGINMCFYCCIAFDLIGLIHVTKEQNSRKVLFIIFSFNCCFSFCPRLFPYFEIILLRISIVLILQFLSRFFYYSWVLFQEMNWRWLLFLLVDYEKHCVTALNVQEREEQCRWASLLVHRLSTCHNRCPSPTSVIISIIYFV